MLDELPVFGASRRRRRRRDCAASSCSFLNASYIAMNDLVLGPGDFALADPERLDLHADLRPFVVGAIGFARPGCPSGTRRPGSGIISNVTSVPGIVSVYGTM